MSDPVKPGNRVKENAATALEPPACLCGKPMKFDPTGIVIWVCSDPNCEWEV